MLFEGGAATVAGEEYDDGRLARGTERPPLAKTAWYAYMEGAVKAIAALLVSAPSAQEVVLSGRMAAVDRVRDDLTRRLATVGAAAGRSIACAASRAIAKQGAQGAALVANGLAGGREAALV